MTLHLNHGYRSFECDCCDEVLDTETKDFDEALEKLREEGWRIVKNSKGEWEHRCTGCR